MVSLSEKNFYRMIELWNDPKIVEEPPYFGWLSNNIPVYPDTLNLETNVSSRDVKDRPYIHVPTIRLQSNSATELPSRGLQRLRQS